MEKLLNKEKCEDMKTGMKIEEGKGAAEKAVRKGTYEGQ